LFKGIQPNNTRWITADERRLAQVRLAEDAGEADKDNKEDSYVSCLIELSVFTSKV
jgi:hypothetical protein